MNASTLLAGHRLPAGWGFSTVLPDLDFETYSEAGYTWDNELNKWVSITKSPPHGLGAVGASAYSEHPSTEVLSLAYDLKDGQGARMWIPSMPPPVELFEHIAKLGLLEAHNSAFEWYIWANVCHARMGWPALPYWLLRDSMAKARAFSLPGKLAKLAEVLKVSDQKIDDGKRLINKLTKPRNPTKKDPRTRIRPEEEPVDGPKFYAYNVGDIKAESAVSALMPDLSTDELELWLLDQCINLRGVHIDSDGLNNCLAIVKQAFEQYTAELISITDGQVQSAGEIGKIINWLGCKGVHMSSIDADHVEEALKRENLPANARRVLEIRALIGAASVKKLFAIDRRRSADGRLRDLFAFCGADRTGRFAGRGPQPQNLPNSGPEVVRCKCDRHYGSHLQECSWCRSPKAFAESAEWGIDAVNDALTVIASKDLRMVEHYFGDAVAAVSGCLRGLFSAAPGCDFLCSDYSAIEAVVLAMLSGEQWRIDVFRTHGKIYEMSAAKISGVPFEELIRHKEETGDHHPLRKKIGKVAELACFSPDTQVLTSVGYVRIMDITSNHYLWDGVEWVQSNGTIHKGQRQTITVDGVSVTPNHPVSLGHSWRGASELGSNPSMLRRALAIGGANIPSSVPQSTKGHTVLSCSARAEAFKNLLLTPICTRVNPHNAQNAGARKAATPTLRNTLNMRRLCLTLRIAADSAIDLVLQSVAAIMKITWLSKTMAGGVSRSALNGESQNGVFCSTYRNYQGGTTLALKWTDWTQTKVTNQVICDSLLNPKMQKINDRFPKCKNALKTLKNVYDIVNAGPRHRFTIKTDTGHLIVHNSGYQGGYGAWLAFGADNHLGEEEIRESIKAWRKESPMIVKFWYGLQDAATAAVQNPGTCYAYNGLTYGVKDDVLYCRLLSGRKLSYHQPRLHPDVTPWGKQVLKLTYMGWNSDYKKGPQGWMRMDTYGGKLCENVVQAIARDILTFAMKNIERAGYAIALHVHDEIVSEVLEGTGSIEEFERIMATMPTWAADWPIRAAGGWRGKRYRKD